MAPADIRAEGGTRIPCKLQTISVTGGLLRMPMPLEERTLVELVILSEAGPILGVAEMLDSAAAALGFTQSFRFLVLDDGDYLRLRTVIASSRDTDDPDFPSGISVRPGRA